MIHLINLQVIQINRIYILVIMVRNVLNLMLTIYKSAMKILIKNSVKSYTTLKMNLINLCKKKTNVTKLQNFYILPIRVL